MNEWDRAVFEHLVLYVLVLVRPEGRQRSVADSRAWHVVTTELPYWVVPTRRLFELAMDHVGWRRARRGGIWRWTTPDEARQAMLLTAVGTKNSDLLLEELNKIANNIGLKRPWNWRSHLTQIFGRRVQYVIPK